jgi:hypothetical protein
VYPKGLYRYAVLGLCLKVLVKIPMFEDTHCHYRRRICHTHVSSIFQSVHLISFLISLEVFNNQRTIPEVPFAHAEAVSETRCEQ